ncbi:hypothetical protein CAI16_05235 [Virgibacillus dokdonensis]|uniref:DUF2513 domain-containing protein n=1 Tax=Virgibacillus dokdonensis TaxID=302167 RepID=A0A3E0WW92_9BACI|nr:DUF2513 domain-containing protein [Virgibacillus dokdonensis]RFA36197.1 hypothetical protein CAI16_05235 [Virgibacillus dokdonensis]
MKLNQECVRSVLLELEEKLTLNDVLTLHQFEKFETYQKFGYDTFAYTLTKLIEAKYIKGSVAHGSNQIIDILITSITWEGHLFLDNIRDNAIWSKTKDAVKSLSSVSLPLLSNVATSVINKHLGLK